MKGIFILLICVNVLLINCDTWNISEFKSEYDKNPDLLSPGSEYLKIIREITPNDNFSIIVQELSLCFSFPDDLESDEDILGFITSKLRDIYNNIKVLKNDDTLMIKIDKYMENESLVMKNDIDFNHLLTKSEKIKFNDFNEMLLTIYINFERLLRIKDRDGEYFYILNKFMEDFFEMNKSILCELYSKRAISKMRDMVFDYKEYCVKNRYDNFDKDKLISIINELSNREILLPGDFVILGGK